MVYRVIEALAGAVLAAVGGYLAWTSRGSVEGMFPPTPGQSIWLFVGGLVALIVGAVTMVHALGPRPKAKAKRVEEEERRARLLKQAEQFYTEKAEELARGNPQDVRFPEGLRPAGMTGGHPVTPSAQPSEPPPEPFRSNGLGQPPSKQASQPPQPPTGATEEKELAPAPAPQPPEPEPVKESAKPEAPAKPAPAATSSSAPTPPAPAAEASLDAPVASRPFPAPVGSIPAATEAPPAYDAPAPPQRAKPPPESPAEQAVPDKPAEAGDSVMAEIRQAIAENRLKDADRLLTETRKQFNEATETKPVELAQLTGLAGDHAAADGRLGSAKWLWRLSLQRFAAAGAIDDPSARAVSERMRLADQ